jgi:hypothetical protein
MATKIDPALEQRIRSAYVSTWQAINEDGGLGDVRTAKAAEEVTADYIHTYGRLNEADLTAYNALPTKERERIGKAVLKGYV